jgi:hypothetical protein
MAVYDDDALVGMDTNDPNVQIRNTAQSLASPLPDPFPPSQQFAGVQFNYYLTAQ